jgi:hypothetical protein
MAIRSIAAGAALLLAAGLLAAGGAAAADQPTPKRWAWMEDTIWYVPPQNLPAILTSADSRKVVRLIDQTVYSIDGYAEGYFWGVVRTQIMPADTSLPADPSDSPNCHRLVGSVTPQGALNLSFTPFDDEGDQTTGIGTMRRFEGEWTMENQMTTGTSAQITHWAYMKYCVKGERCPLPAIKGTARAFLAPCKKELGSDEAQSP